MGGFNASSKFAAVSGKLTLKLLHRNNKTKALELIIAPRIANERFIGKFSQNFVFLLSKSGNFRKAAILALATLVLAVALIFAPVPTSAQSGDIAVCSSLSRPEDRARCLEDFSRQVETSNQLSDLPGGWKLVRTPDPRGRREAVSIMHPSDTKRSDLGLAGLTLRCGRTGIDVVVVLLMPLREARQPVVIASERGKNQFEATAIQGGLALQLPPQASEIATADWKTSVELTIEVAGKGTAIRGVIPTTGFATALDALRSSCRPK